MKKLEMTIDLGFDEVDILLVALGKHQDYIAELSRLAHSKWIDEADLNEEIRTENRETLDEFLSSYEKIKILKEKLENES